MEEVKVCGIDLSAKEKNPTGICILEGCKLFTRLVYRDDQILEFIKSFRPKVTAIDAPLSYSSKPYRRCEEELIKLGSKFLPLNMKSMEELTARALRIKYEVEKFGRVIETHPRSIEKISGIRIPEDLKKLNMKLMNLLRSDHEKDAILCALAAYGYLLGKYVEFGNSEGKIILPKL